MRRELWLRAWLPDVFADFLPEWLPVVESGRLKPRHEVCLCRLGRGERGAGWVANVFAGMFAEFLPVCLPVLPRGR